MHRSNLGFTLVELLVVITIIGVLLALLIPAVSMVREEGRQTVCLNNQKQVGTAILAYENAKQRLPGVLNQIPGGVSYNWVEAIFPYMERADLWETLRINNATQVAAIQKMRIKELICPNDPNTIDPTSPKAQALLSYGVNDQFFVDESKNPPQDRTGKVVARASLSKLTDRTVSVAFPHGANVSPSTTIMLGERTGDGTTNYPRAGNPAYPTSAAASAPSYTTAGKWTDSPSANPSVPTLACWNSLTFHWPAPTEKALSVFPGIMTSVHPGKVIAIFFDNHAEKIPSETVYPTGQ